MTLEELKIAIGIGTANCSTCAYKGWESPGSDDPFEPSWPVCDREENAHYSNLKSFPFKKEMTCWYPNFWASKFPERIKTAEDDEMDALYKEFKKNIDKWVNSQPTGITG